MRSKVFKHMQTCPWFPSYTHALHSP